MSDIVIRAERLSKLYKIGVLKQRHDTLRDQLVHSFKSLFSGNRHHPPQPSTPPSIDGRPDIIWALKGFSFEVRQGEVVGIIGRNAAGKSTLLKILSRITEPTSGRAEIHGRVGSLLEVGTGFHPELTGRDNIYLNGAMLGMRKREINHKFDEIVAFAEIERSIDTPVKRFSSGMYVRLAFAVAAYLEPEILIVDEVLAVGDAEFQKRCLGRMGEVAREGRTVLFVSHNMQAVRRLCRRAILLEQGQVVEDGETEPVVRRYLTAVEPPELGRRRWDAGEQPGTDLCRATEVRVTDEAGSPATTYLSSQPIVVTLEFELARTDTAFSAAFDLAAVDGSVVFRSAHTDAPEASRPRLVQGLNAV